MVFIKGASKVKFQTLDLIVRQARAADVKRIEFVLDKKKNRVSGLEDWIGKYLLVPQSKPRRGIYTSPGLRRRLTVLLGTKYYRCLVYGYYVMGKDGID